jgi:hypothetical protein
MSKMTEIVPYSLVNLMADLHKGIIRIPDFQRDIIWTREQVQELLESVDKGYPLGSILLWKTTEELKIRDPLELKIGSPAPGSEISYLLDGQQRLISLYSVLHGKLELGKKIKTKLQVFYNLDEKDEDKKFAIASEDELKEKPLELENGYLPMARLFSFGVDHATSINSNILMKLAGTPERSKTYTQLYVSFWNLQFPAVKTGQSLSVACNIFERLNNTGTQLTVADLMVAITYKRDFNLRVSLANLNEQFDQNYFAIDGRTVLQCMSSCFKQGTEKDDITSSANEIQPEWSKTTEALKLAIDFLKKHCQVPTSNFLPYEITLAPLTFYFYINSGKKPNEETLKRLKKYFWFNMFSERYTSSQPSKTAEDIENMLKLSSNPTVNLFNYYEGTITKQKIMETEMASNSSFALTILCFLALQTPREFKNNEIVTLDQTFGESNQKQLHHIFPINYLKTKFSKERHYLTEVKPYINSIANISLISKGTNRAIWDSEPSLYFSQFEKENQHLQMALDSHLIQNLDDFGILTNDFPKFIGKRAEVIANAINDFANSLK